MYILNDVGLKSSISKSSTFNPPLLHTINVFEMHYENDIRRLLKQKNGHVYYNLSCSEERALNELVQNSDIHYMKVDKGGGIVVMNVTDYNDAMVRILQNVDGYRSVRKYEITRCYGYIYNILYDLLMNSEINNELFEFLYVENPKIEKPHIRVIPQEETRIGSKVTIECNSSNSRNNLTRCWFYKDNKWLGHLLHSSSTSAVQYVIQNATAQDEGSYTCQCYKAQNQSTETSNPVKLAINQFLEKPQIRVIPQEETRIGSKVTIECSSSNSRYDLTSCWFYKDNKWLGHPLHSSSTSAVQYVIQNATAQDEGSYTCQCYNAQNQSTETSNPVKLGINQYDHTVVNLIRLCLGLIVLLLMVIFTLESTFGQN
ncbi:uncharacterized protein LOC122815369 [Protopterus annectens]|uniref:uncharacterized protein LOC122815369 n=1 Tax=Protopterus annectens TaxID=7888 RepID=UPI001CFC23C2|nr:uncharacterized protein LOC122815369 [Protopterus annectens]